MIKLASTLTIIIVVLASGTRAQFSLLDSGVDQDLHCVHFADTDTGFAAGLEGTLIRTTDGGRHWRALDPGTREDIND